MTQEYFLGFSGLNKQCFTWDKSQGVICFASNEVAVKETLSTKKQLLFTHSMEPIVKILSNLPKKLLYTACYEDGAILLAACDYNTAKLLHQTAINEKHIVSLALSQESEVLLVGCVSGSNTGIYLYDYKLKLIRGCHINNLSLVELKWSIFNRSVFTGLFLNKVKLFKYNLDIEQKDLSFSNLVSPEYFQNYKYTTFSECIVGSSTTNPSYLVMAATDEGIIHVYCYKDSNMLFVTECVYGGVINYIGVFENKCIIGGKSPILNAYPHSDIKFIHSAKQVLFYSKPDALLLDSDISEIMLHNDGNEGLVSTVQSTIWYVNYTERATIRIISAHYSRINSIDTVTAWKGDVSYIKPSNMATCSDDRSIRVWSLDNYDQLLAFRQKSIPKVVRFSTYLKNVLFVGNEDGTFNILDLKHVKLIQSLKICSQEIKWILEINKTYLIAVSIIGEVILLILENSDLHEEKEKELNSNSNNNLNLENYFVEVRYTFVNMNTIGATVTHVAQSTLEPEFRFLVCTAEGHCFSYIRAIHDQSSPSITLTENQTSNNINGINIEYQIEDDWDLLFNPHGITNDDDLALNSKLYKNTKQVQVQVEYSLSTDKRLVGIVDSLQYVYIRDYERHQVLERIPICSYPKFMGVWDEHLVFVTLVENNTIKVNLWYKKYEVVSDIDDNGKGKDQGAQDLLDGVYIQRNVEGGSLNQAKAGDGIKLFYRSASNLLVKKLD